MTRDDARDTPAARDEARGFAAFPAGRHGGRAFARSWWGRAWIQAVEDSALDGKALKSGRRYAYSGRVGTITVSPGRLSAPVYGESGDVHRTVQLVQPLTSRQWDLFLDQVAASAGHVAALVDRDMPHDLAAAAEDVGVPLLPGIGDLDPSCDCDDWGHPCRHAAALAYQAAWLLDTDPFVLLLMRGLGEERFLGALQRRGAATSRPAETAGRPPLPAADVYAAVPAALPVLPPPPESPGDMPDVPGGPGVDPEALRLLAREAAVRAFALLADGAAPGTSDGAEASGGGEGQEPAAREAPAGP
ncbi:SWIM zinc finger family protein [Yinghuangia sp. ASG 101]|uniref:SWIM zinc finger family protein n=1 Tax=Yinghuangia sp. ASG 101 TaxID=2896848 RepID=UPI001E40818A|nr:SWIM zinc finger family protein [Yinghuangia sp. ASG 101]UGQ13031.1 SWIM zinc finger family protein [Yinghuangia sp. ASG 101]